MCPPGALLAREASCDVTLGGCFLPKGTPVLAPCTPCTATGTTSGQPEVSSLTVFSIKTLQVGACRLRLLRVAMEGCKVKGTYGSPYRLLRTAPFAAGPENVSRSEVCNVRV